MKKRGPTEWRLNTPARSHQLRTQHDRGMYAWGTNQPLPDPYRRSYSQACHSCRAERSGSVLQVRLVRWPNDDGRPRKKVLREADLRKALHACQA